MFGLIRKKVVMDALVDIAKSYDSQKKQPGLDFSKSLYYSFGNMNCANYIWTKIGCGGTILKNGVPQDGKGNDRRKLPLKRKRNPS